MRKLNVLLAAFLALPLFAIDPDFLRAWERVHERQPETLASTARIAPESEPGAPLTIRGAVVDGDERAIRDAVVFAYQTDAEGLYDRPGTPPHSWRLHGWARTDAQGRFTFQTIRPASYPNTRIRPHVHFTVVRSNGWRYLPHELELAHGDTAPAVDVILRLEEGRRF